MINPFNKLIQIYTQKACQTPSVLDLLYSLEKEFNLLIQEINKDFSNVDNEIANIIKKIKNLDLNQSNIYETLTSLQQQINEIIAEAGTTIYDDDVPLPSINIDSEPTEDSNNLVKSGGVFTALQSKQNTLTFDNSPTEDSNNPVKSGGVYSALAEKQNSLTFDNVPTENSNNPVKSGGVYDSIQNVVEVASGKTASYVVDDTISANTAFNSQNTTITITAPFTDVNKGSITLDKLTVGDVIYVTQTDVPDRWVQTIVESSGSYTVTLNKMETAKIPVIDVTIDNNSIVSNNIGKLYTENSNYDSSNNKLITKNDLLNIIYPIGSLYLSVSDTSPSSFIGGTWSKLSAGYALWTASANAGDTISAGLPNIKGEIELYSANLKPETASATSAIYATGSYANGIQGSKADLSDHLDFDASRCSSIYNDNITTVQPPAYKVYAWRRMA